MATGSELFVGAEVIAMWGDLIEEATVDKIASDARSCTVNWTSEFSCSDLPIEFVLAVDKNENEASKAKLFEVLGIEPRCVEVCGVGNFVPPIRDL